MPRHHACLELCGVALVVALSVACGDIARSDSTRALLTTPSAGTLATVPDAPRDSARTLVKGTVTFTLADGVFKLTSSAGDLTGTYGGLVRVPDTGRPTAALTLVVTGGSNLFAGASGTLVGDGRGAFVTGGDFNLSVDGTLRTSAQPGGSRLRVNISGIATVPLTCSASNRRLSQLQGTGNIPNLGRSTMQLESEIVQTNCF
ncbi:MAG: hypothetical protein HOP16_02985 [Acidobacteria bacterium]|nr:hypothetical protein [Acidobacteriota bacterium]